MIFDADLIDRDVVFFQVILDEEHVLAPVIAAAEHVFPTVGGATGEFVEVRDEVGEVAQIVNAGEDHDGENDVPAALRAKEIEKGDAAEDDEEGEAGEDVAEVDAEFVLGADKGEKSQGGGDEDDQVGDGGFAVVEARGDAEEPAEQAVGEVSQAGEHDELGDVRDFDEHAVEVIVPPAVPGLPRAGEIGIEGKLLEILLLLVDAQNKLFWERHGNVPEN